MASWGWRLCTIFTRRQCDQIRRNFAKVAKLEKSLQILSRAYLGRVHTGPFYAVSCSVSDKQKYLMCNEII